MMNKPLLAAALLILGGWGAALAAKPTAAPALPWQREQPLREAASTATIEGELTPRCPAPSLGWPGGPAFPLTNPEIKSSLWGPAGRVTLSAIKTDVFDRRVGSAPVLTLDEIREGAFAPANKALDQERAGTRRPYTGYLTPGGGRSERYAYWHAYPFPCEKPVGQIILGLDELNGAAPPRIVQCCADGVARLEIARGAARANLEVALSMTRNIYAIRGRLAGIKAPWLRLYRHQDQAHRQYMDADGKTFKPFTSGDNNEPFDYAKDAAWNGPLAAPEAGSDGRFFWVRQRFPAEKSFPRGFECVLMGVLDRANASTVTAVNGAVGLGTPPYAEGSQTARFESGYALIRKAPGSAATAGLMPDQAGSVTAYVAVVTTSDAADPLAEARRRLESAAEAGFNTLVAENARWYGKLYDGRENGRVFYGDSGRQASEDIAAIFRSWYCNHGSGTTPDMRRLEALAHYASLEQDWQPWHGLPCYNEPFYTPAVVRNRADAVAMWWQLVEHWLPPARANTREMFGMPGAAILHGYLPPVKADRYIHTNCALELCIDTAAQMLKAPWDEWDYGGDPAFLKTKVYPALRELAIFYAAFARQGEDGFYHAAPVLEAEAWGIFPGFSHNKDAISVLCMMRWTFLRAAEAAEFLGADADLAPRWREIAGKLAPYPVYDTPGGRVFTTLAGVAPSWQKGDHPWYVGVYPTTLADEITLDSPRELREQMIRTAYSAPAGPSSEVLVLLGACPDRVASMRRESPAPIADTTMLRAEVNRYPERLINSRSGRIHLFPCVPEGSVLAFRHFQARGGFAVSAARDKGGITVVEIEARRDNTCRLMNPWPGRPVALRQASTGRMVPFTVDKSNGECLIFAARKGERYRLDH